MRSKYIHNHGPDIRLVLDHFQPSEEHRQARAKLLDHLFKILRKHFGAGFDVEYVGIGSYATDINQAPFEVAIIDVNNELEIVGKEYTRDLPGIYSPSAVMRALEKEGFHGKIKNHSLSRTTAIGPMATEGYVRLPQTGGSENQEWHGFDSIPRRGLIYPERLLVEYPVPFELILPGPATMPLVHMLNEFNNPIPAFRDLVSISYLWCYSLGMKEISPTCLALLLVSFMQVTAGMPPITFSTCGIDNYVGTQHFLSKNGGKWALHAYLENDRWLYEIVALETEFQIQTDPKYTDLDKSRLLRNFMRYLDRISRNSRTSIVSLGTGKKFSRDLVPYLGSTIDSLPPFLCKSADTPYSMLQPPQLWKIHPLIIQDPFMYTHNHAEFVSVQTLNALSHNSPVAVRKLDTGHSLVEILGIEGVGPADALRRELGLQDKVAQHVKLARSATIRRVRSAIRLNFGNEYKVELFGSTSYGVDAPTSDLDLVIIDTERTNGFSPSVNFNNLPRIYNVKNLAEALRKAGFGNTVAIPGAIVPIVKFNDPSTRLECDINVNNQLGFINTSMIKQYVTIQPILIPLLRLIKQWAKRVGMNSPSKWPMSFSSYALTLMTIAWFQSSGWLPNLQEDVSGGNAAPADHFWIKDRNGQRIRCDTRFRAVESWSVSTGRSVGELFFEWLGFWGREFDSDRSVACIRRGGIVPRLGKSARKNQNPAASKQEFPDNEQDGEADEEAVVDESFNADWSRDLMCVADPFIETKNCAGPIKKFIFTRFVHECRNTEGMLGLGISLQSILSREPPSWKTQAILPTNRNVKKKQKNKTGGGDAGKVIPGPKPRPQPETVGSGAQGSGGNTRRSGRGGRRGAPTRTQAGNP